MFTPDNVLYSNSQTSSLTILASGRLTNLRPDAELIRAIIINLLLLICSSFHLLRLGRLDINHIRTDDGEQHRRAVLRCRAHLCLARCPRRLLDSTSALVWTPLPAHLLHGRPGHGSCSSPPDTAGCAGCVGERDRCCFAFGAGSDCKQLPWMGRGSQQEASS